MKSPHKLLERDIQASIMQFLKFRGVFAWKNSTIGIYKQSTGSYIPSQSVGSPDIIGIINGKFIGIEVKRQGGKLSVYQQLFQQSVQKNGGIYWIFTSIDECIDTVEKYLTANT